jgi:hypothetical protein
MAENNATEIKQYVTQYVKAVISHDELVEKTGLSDLAIWDTMQALGFSELEEVHPADIEKQVNEFMQVFQQSVQYKRLCKEAQEDRERENG